MHMKETTILVPKVVYDKARDLRTKGFYELAIELIEDNKIQFDVYTPLEKKDIKKRNKNADLRI